MPSISDTLKTVFTMEVTVTTAAPSMDVVLMVSSSFPSSTVTEPQSVMTSTKVADPESAEVTLAPLDIVLPDGQNVTIPAGTAVLGLQDPWHCLVLMLLQLIPALLLNCQCLLTQMIQ